MTKEEMILYEHKFKPYRKLMGKEKMAAQFMPFAALTGFEKIIAETMRETMEEKELCEDQVNDINQKLNILKFHIGSLIKVKYFKIDATKPGGSYLIKKGTISKIDINRKIIIFEDKSYVLISQINDIEILNLLK